MVSAVRKPTRWSTAADIFMSAGSVSVCVTPPAIAHTCQAQQQPVRCCCGHCNVLIDAHETGELHRAHSCTFIEPPPHTRVTPPNSHARSTVVPPTRYHPPPGASTPQAVSQLSCQAGSCPQPCSRHDSSSSIAGAAAHTSVRAHAWIPLPQPQTHNPNTPLCARNPQPPLRTHNPIPSVPTHLTTSVPSTAM